MQILAKLNFVSSFWINSSSSQDSCLCWLFHVQLLVRLTLDMNHFAIKLLHPFTHFCLTILLEYNNMYVHVHAVYTLYMCGLYMVVYVCVPISCDLHHPLGDQSWIHPSPQEELNLHSRCDALHQLVEGNSSALKAMVAIFGPQDTGGSPGRTCSFINAKWSSCFFRAFSMLANISCLASLVFCSWSWYSTQKWHEAPDLVAGLEPVFGKQSQMSKLFPQGWQIKNV